jgi:hypothetical protein
MQYTEPSSWQAEIWLNAKLPTTMQNCISEEWYKGLVVRVSDY